VLTKEGEFGIKMNGKNGGEGWFHCKMILVSAG